MIPQSPLYEIIHTGPITIHVTGSEAFTRRIAPHNAEIEAAWTEAVAESSGRIFNGSMLNYSSHEITDGAAAVTCHFAGYKHLIAQLRRPALDLGIRPVGTSGIIVVTDSAGREHLVFARRSMSTSIFQGMYELVPAGTVDDSALTPDGTIDFHSKLLEELSEELGILPPAAAITVTDYAFILDTANGVFDACCRIDISGHLDLIASMLAVSGEYDRPEIIPADQAAAFVDRHRSEMVATSAALTDLYVSLLR